MKNAVLGAVFGAIATVAVYEVPAYLSSGSVGTIYAAPLKYFDFFTIENYTRIKPQGLDACKLYGATITFVEKVNEEYVVSVVSEPQILTEDYCQVGDLVVISEFDWNRVLEKNRERFKRSEQEKALLEFVKSQ